MGKIYKKKQLIVVNFILVTSESYHHNSYHRPTDKKFIYAHYSVLSKKNELGHESSKFKVVHRVRITKYKNIFSRGYTKNWLKEIFANVQK